MVIIVILFDIKQHNNRKNEKIWPQSINIQDYLKRKPI